MSARHRHTWKTPIAYRACLFMTDKAPGGGPLLCFEQASKVCKCGQTLCPKHDVRNATRITRRDSIAPAERCKTCDGTGHGLGGMWCVPCEGSGRSPERKPRR